jgi:O-antigen/teichoic acid export membrane protein
MEESAPASPPGPEAPVPHVTPTLVPGGNSKPEGTTATIARNSFWLLIDNVSALVASFYCSILVARKLGPDLMGRYNYVLWFATVLKMISDVAIPATFRKFSAEFMGRGDYSVLKTMVRVTLRLQVKLAIAGATIGLLIVHYRFAPDQQQLASLAVLTIVPALLLSVPAGVLYGTENLRYNVICSTLSIAVNLIGVTVAVLMQWGLTAIVGSLLVSRVFDCLLRFAMFRKLARNLPGEAADRLDPKLRARLIRFAALQLVPTLLYAFLFDRTEVFFINKLSVPAQIAFFSLSFTLVQQLLIVPQTLAGSASVTIMVKQGHAPAEAARIAAQATWLTILFGAPELFGVAALSAPLLHVMYGAKYLPAIPVLATLSFFALGLAASQSAQFLLVAAERQVFYIVWLLVSAAIDVVGCQLFIPHYGALGAAYAKGISQLVAAAGFLGFMVLKFHVTLPVWRIIKLITACVAMYAGVRFVGLHLPPLLAIIVGVPLGVAIFVVLMRWLRCLDSADRERLRGIASLLPARTRGLYRAILDIVAPARPSEDAVAVAP